jgi:hypothetical protein
MVNWFFSACGVITLAGAAWVSLEVWREVVSLLTDTKMPAKQIAGDCFAFAMMFAVVCAAMVSAVHSVARVWL